MHAIFSSRPHQVTTIRHNDEDIHRNASELSAWGFLLPPALAASALMIAWLIIRRQQQEMNIKKQVNQMRSSSRVSPASTWAARAMNLSKEARTTEESISRLIVLSKKGSSSSFLGEAGDYITGIVNHYSSAPLSSRITGIRVDYSIGACLIYLEGDTSSLCALLREINEIQSELHGLSPHDTRVILFEPESSLRFYAGFYEAKVASDKRGAAAGQVSLPQADEPLSLEQRLIESGEAIDLFIRLLASKVESIPDLEAKEEALMDMVGLLAMSPPNGQMVLDLATQRSLPSVETFVDEFDLEFIRYKEILDKEELDKTIPDMQRLQFLYDLHFKREKKLIAEVEAKARADLASSPLARFLPPKVKGGSKSALDPSRANEET